MAGAHVVTPLVDVLLGERHSLPPGTTVVLVTAVITQSLAEEVAEIKQQGYEVLALYAGDGDPQIELPGVTVFPVGQALEAFDVHEQVLEH